MGAKNQLISRQDFYGSKLEISPKEGNSSSPLSKKVSNQAISANEGESPRNPAFKQEEA